MPNKLIGIDTGGTFTDFLEIDEMGNMHFDKTFSTPKKPENAIIRILEQISEEKDTCVEDYLKQIVRFAHGTTVATNALIERKGTKVGLITTAGFEDNLLIARGPIGRTGGLPYLEALNFIHTERPKPLVEKESIIGVNERIDSKGEVVISLNTKDVERAIHRLLNQNVKSIAVCFLWSFINPEHEQIVKQMINEVAPHIPVNLSSEISPFMGEFERTVTTIINGYISPVIDQYIQTLSNRLESHQFQGRLEIMKSSGGLLLPESVHKQAVSTINSGPVGGLVAARYLGSQMGIRNMITSDMGGTSFDVGLIVDDHFEEEKFPFLDQGLPVQIPAIKMVTIGAGGGSIAWADGNRLMVGPRSAGSEPGPACYANGGEEPTVTDALVVLGIIHPDSFFGGRRKLNMELARNAIQKLADKIGLSVMETAAGIYEVVTAKMGDLIRKVTVESGHDPRQFDLISYGGATAAHCALFAKQLGIPRVVIPYTASVFSAYGIAISDVLYTYMKAEPIEVQDSNHFVTHVNQMFTDLREQAKQEISELAEQQHEFFFTYKIDLRYKGQMNELTLHWPQGYLEPQDVARVCESFESLYEQKFGKGTTRRETPLELINFRLEALKISNKPKLSKICLRRENQIGNIARTTRNIYIYGLGYVEASVYDFSDLVIHENVIGPAIIERKDTTIWLPPECIARIDEFGNILISSKEVQQ